MPLHPLHVIEKSSQMKCWPVKRFFPTNMCACSQIAGDPLSGEYLVTVERPFFLRRAAPTETNAFGAI